MLIKPVLKKVNKVEEFLYEVPNSEGVFYTRVLTADDRILHLTFVNGEYSELELPKRLTQRGMLEVTAEANQLVSEIEADYKRLFIFGES